MSASIRSLIASGTKLWLDSIDPELVAKNRALGATGATSNPIIIADLLKSGRFNDLMKNLKAKGLDAEQITWAATDDLVSRAEQVFLPVFKETHGNDGYVSFELDPLLEDAACTLSLAEKAAKYVRLGKQWSDQHPNRMIKVPATPGGLAALEELAAAGVPLTVTLIFTERQYRDARNAIWQGAKSRGDLSRFKSVYSIFVSRLDVYTESHEPNLSAGAQGLVGIVNAKRLWRLNQDFWRSQGTPLQQEIIFASTGTKKPGDKPWRYVAAFAGSDIQTNPPATNDAVAESGQIFEARIAELPPPSIHDEIINNVDWQKLEKVLMQEGLAKFADPQKALLKLVASLTA